MKGRISNWFRVLSAVALVGSFLTICSLTTFSAHATESNRQTRSCGSSCTPHFQVTSQGVQHQIDEDDKEPTPPFYAWQGSINSLTLYIAPVIVIGLLGFRLKEFLLSTHLRF